MPDHIELPSSPSPSAPSSAATPSLSPLLTQYALDRRAAWGLHIWRVAVVTVWVSVGVAVIGGVVVLSGAFFCLCEGSHDSARNQAYELAKSVEIFKLQQGRLPMALEELATNVDGHGAIMDEIPLDPWGRDYRFVRPNPRTDAEFLIWSAGPDGRFMTDDDIGNWTDEVPEPALRRRRS